LVLGIWILFAICDLVLGISYLQLCLYSLLEFFNVLVGYNIGFSGIIVNISHSLVRKNDRRDSFWYNEPHSTSIDELVPIRNFRFLSPYKGEEAR
jgi:hypothetical protein